MNFIQNFRCPGCGSRGLQLQRSGQPVEELLPERGELVCGECAARYPIRDFILDMQLRRARLSLTLAGLSNQAPLAPQMYETLWRPHSLDILTHGAFSTRSELRLLTEWAQPQPQQLVVDLGSSTGLYARSLARVTRQWDADAPAIVALDLAPGMLRASHGYALREGLRSIAHVRAPVQHLPFADDSVNLVVCGGSLNEFQSMPVALAEARRVLCDTGMLFSMSLTEAQGRLGSLAQRSARMSGIQFPTLAEFNALAQAAGLRITRQHSVGVVTFSLMEKTAPDKGRASVSMQPAAIPGLLPVPTVLTP